MSAPRDAEVLDAVRAMLDDETARATGAAPVLAESDGWRSTGDARGPLRRAEWDVEAWRWFALVDLAVADEVVLVVFRWLDPATPALTYSTFAHVDGLSSAAAAAVVRQAMRRLLAPGWRDRVERTWLGGEKVLVQRRRDVDPRFSEVRAEVDRLRWSTPRTGHEAGNR